VPAFEEYSSHKSFTWFYAKAHLETFLIFVIQISRLLSSLSLKAEKTENRGWRKKSGKTLKSRKLLRKDGDANEESSSGGKIIIRNI
jgi:hypothetical protein